MKVETEKMLGIVGTSSSPFPTDLHFDLTFARKNFEYELNYVFEFIVVYAWF